MSDERDTPTAGSTTDLASESGAPVVEAEPTDTEVREALNRAGELPTGADASPSGEASTATGSTEAPDAATAASDPASSYAEPAPTEAMSLEEVAEATSTGRREIVVPEELPSAGPTRVEPPAAPATGGMLISPDHPMAALYMQTPMPPDLRGNRAAGVLISLLGTLGFALVFAGVLALWLAPDFPPSTFFTEGLLPWLISWPFIAAVVAFFVGMALIVLVVGRAGWWAYVLGGFLVAVLVWVAFVAVSAFFGWPDATGDELRGIGTGLFGVVDAIGFSVPAIAAAVVAREATVWFGAWIGSRGRKITKRNAATVAEYEQSLAEAQAKQQ